jgi:hypothetical protein
MTKEELFNIIRWHLRKRRIYTEVTERIDIETNSHPTSNFIIKSSILCKKLIKDVNLN